MTISDPTAPPLSDNGATTYLVDDELTQDDLYTGGDVQEAETTPDTAPTTPQAPPLPVPPPILVKRLVRGRYRSGGTGYQLEVRVDVGGTRPMNRISGDFFYVSGGTESYFGSFRVDAPTVTTTATEVRLEGPGQFTFSAGAPYVRVTVPRRFIWQPQAPATVQFVTPPNTPGATYACAFVSSYFRSVEWEQDFVVGTTPFVAYDTAALPAPVGSPAGLVDVQRAYRLAGVEMLASGNTNAIPVAAAGVDAKWTDAELHDAMVTHFSRWANIPQWKVWLIVATQHVDGWRGIMFDAGDTHERQGCAVFDTTIGGQAPFDQRAQLRTYVHELGHAFNLLHSWQKHLADPPQPLGDNNGLGDLSWMNYVDRFQPSNGPGGTAAYWAAFPFQFTDREVIHLRHAFYRNIVMGGDAFGQGAAEVDPHLFAEPVRDRSGLAIEVRAKDAFAYGEPVVVELKLSSTDTRGTATHGYLHPNEDFVTIAIRQPSGRTVLFRPLIRHCADEGRTVMLMPGEARYESAFIGYGGGGAYFDQPGRYAVRASYLAADGSRIVSPVTEVRVRPPVTAQDVAVGELLLGDQQGQLLALLGSDSRHLRDGNAAFDALLAEHGDHPLASFARLARGVNAARAFKEITADKRTTVRPPDPATAIAELSRVREAADRGEGVDNITLNLVMRTQAKAEARAGDTDRAAEILDGMPAAFEARGVNPAVVETVRRQAADARVELLGDG
ncbi:hypothetical protein [Virgisporangium ochraceum]|uniref:Uncharacterized protein n=1 Tax=Virgisporangium ochraceum TaxID=65505 RepID=A0A8J4A3G5_9ACTN|nr:hypothetical protein [Virgisporangium ochraceum]GIJ75034.1 hypothetical protein Voc01_099510 [Virgisporangium ochraceum]